MSSRKSTSSAEAVPSPPPLANAIGFDSSDILISLPQPGHSENVDKASVIANAAIRLTKKGADGGDVTTSGVWPDLCTSSLSNSC